MITQDIVLTSIQRYLNIANVRWMLKQRAEGLLYSKHHPLTQEFVLTRDEGIKQAR